jgi:hypothetical protein
MKKITTTGLAGFLTIITWNVPKPNFKNTTFNNTT